MLNFKSKRVKELEKKAKHLENTIKDFSQISVEEGNLIEFISRYVGTDFIKRLPILDKRVECDEGVRMVLGILTDEELEKILEIEE